MRPIIIGMNNPHSTDPRYVLFPTPPGCAGWRLWRMIADVRPGTYRQHYIDVFDRRNLLVGNWSRRRAIEAAATIELPRGATVVLLGAELRDTFDLPARPIHPIVDTSRGVVFRQVPHPSGRCLWYNNEENRRLVGALLSDLMDEYYRRVA